MTDRLVSTNHYNFIPERVIAHCNLELSSLIHQISMSGQLQIQVQLAIMIIAEILKR